MQIFDIFQGILGSIQRVFFAVWWVIIPIVLFIILKNLWLIYVRTKLVKSLKWKVFEIKIPKEILQTPKAMEQIFIGLYQSYSYGFKWMKKWLDGEMDKWFSFEIVGYSGGAYFYVYAPEDKKNLVESVIYAQYPDAEVHEVEDYTDLLPSVLPNEVYDLWGTELVLARDNYYPIKTYQHFESPVEEQRLDPMAIITEGMSKLKEGEIIWMQILISPTGELTGNNWKKEGEEKIDEIVGRKKKKKESWTAEIYAWMKNLLWAPTELPIWPSEKKPEEAKMKFLSPDEQDLVKEIANKISKLGYETLIRFVYIDRQDSFTPANVAAVMGFFHQFNTQNLNAFKPNAAITMFDSLLARVFKKYKKWRVLYRKRKIFDHYRKRQFGKYNKIRNEKFSVLNTEELATIYHFPGVIVEAPKLRRLESKKGGPPTGLPIE